MIEAEQRTLENYIQVTHEQERISRIYASQLEDNPETLFKRVTNVFPGVFPEYQPFKEMILHLRANDKKVKENREYLIKRRNRKIEEERKELKRIIREERKIISKMTIPELEEHLENIPPYLLTKVGFHA